MKYTDVPHRNAALGIFPSVSGFGWTIFDGPLSHVDGGVSTVAHHANGDRHKNARSLRGVGKLIDQYRPATVVLEAFDAKTTKRHERIRSLSQSIISLAMVNGIRVRIVSRDEIRSCFTSRPETRYEVAQIVASYLAELRHKLPKKRNAWESDKAIMSRFNATALLIVHYANPSEPL